MIINHNMSAINANRQMATNQSATAKSTEKLSSGLRINRAGDDAAGLAISEKMRAQISGLTQASRNAQDGISMIQTAEGALNESHSILQRMRELAVQSSNDTNTKVDRNELQKEVDQLTEELTRISTDTEFNTQTLLDGSIGKNKVTSTTNASVTGSSQLKADGKISAAAAGALNELSSVSADDAKLAIEIDGKKLEIDLSYDGADSEGKATNALQTAATGLTAGDEATKLNDLATGLQTDINNAIANYNKNVAESEQLKDVTVAITDGSFVIESGTAGKEGSIKVGASEAAGLLGVSEKNSKTQSGGLQFQIGANKDQNIKITIEDMSAKALGVENIDITKTDVAETAISTIDKAIQDVSSQRANIGAYQNRLDHTINNLGTSSENLTAAESRIRDVDMAEEMMEFTKNNVLSQASQAMLAQAKALPNQVLSLLQ